MLDNSHPGRHRLGTPGLVHCRTHDAVAAALEGRTRTWWSALLVPARHTLAGLRRRAGVAAVERAWVVRVRPA
ncbi:hypothetical protein [Actinokineospora sp. NBRC 105648]|uniref:hypothetical protein n=1 Tax=Actinokineospora sp. NBRC 105648 TaxID=3032206 RepID=UPI0024A38E70|nr:hypothetical protein [Actinokineospora sp. NBRC 105648]GLZ36751.1 hypothetical protein Acsp05_03760 [Actinokineospora sp. NBRC 105648]